MGAESNQFWRLRSKHGKDRIVESPEKLAEAADEYFQWCLDNPINVDDFKGKDADRVTYHHPRPFLKNEIARFCHLAQWRSIEELKEVKGKEEDYSQVIARIEGIIADRKYTYAVIRVFDSNIVARDLGLIDQQKVENTGAQSVIIESASPEEEKANQKTLDDIDKN